MNVYLGHKEAAETVNSLLLSISPLNGVSLGVEHDVEVTKRCFLDVV